MRRKKFGIVALLIALAVGVFMSAKIKGMIGKVVPAANTPE